MDDLKRFSIKVLLIDEFDEVTDILAELVRLYEPRTVFISASAMNYAPWGRGSGGGFRPRAWP